MCQDTWSYWYFKTLRHIDVPCQELVMSHIFTESDLPTKWIVSCNGHTDASGKKKQPSYRTYDWRVTSQQLWRAAFISVMPHSYFWYDSFISATCDVIYSLMRLLFIYVSFLLHICSVYRDITMNRCAACNEWMCSIWCIHVQCVMNTCAMCNVYICNV